MTEGKIREIVREELAARRGGGGHEVTLELDHDEFKLLIEMAGYAAGALAADKLVSDECSGAAAKLAESIKWRATYHNVFYKES